MNLPSINDPLSEREVNIIQQTAVEYRSGLDFNKIKNIVQTGSDGFQRLMEQELTDMSPEEQTAFYILMARAGSYDEDYLIKLEFMLLERMIQLGADAIREYDDYFRFEPCIELIFELSYNELEDMSNYVTELKQSRYETTSRQYTHEFQNHYYDAISKNQGREKIVELLEIYRNIVGLFETTFPNLLALKRIKDGEEPSVEVLQNKKFTSVCRELVNTDEEPNSVYFDLIVNKYERKLRNGLSHGDIINDTVEKEVRISSSNKSYSYSEIGSLVESNLSTAYFLSGFYTGLIKWRYNTYELENINRDRLDI